MCVCLCVCGWLVCGVCVYIYMHFIVLIYHALPVIIKALWQLVHLGTPMDPWRACCIKTMHIYRDIYTHIYNII